MTASRVTLSFNDQMQRLRIPFTAIKVFADPGVEFGLQFTLEEDGEPPAVEPVKLLGGAGREAQATRARSRRTRCRRAAPRS